MANKKVTASDIKRPTFICSRCDTKFNSPAHFYKSNSGFNERTGCLPICKSCFTQMFNYYLSEYGDGRRAMRRMCLAFDLYYNDDIYSACVGDLDALVGSYMQKLNLVQYKGKTFDDSLNEGFYFKGHQKQIKPLVNKSAKPEISKSDVKRWGAGFEAIDYEILNSHYKLLKEANPDCDTNQEIFIDDLCYTKMQQMKALRDGKTDDSIKLTDSYRKTFQQAGLNTKKEQTQTEESDISVDIDKIEKYTPAEYYKNKKLYKDFDGLGDYITRLLVRPLRNLERGTDERDYEYYVKDGEVVDE